MRCDPDVRVVVRGAGVGVGSAPYFTKLTGTGQSLTEARFGAVAATLPSGQVLIAGGYNGSGYLSSAELFNPATDTFTKLTGTGQSLTEARYGAVAATLPSGQVLIAGGYNGSTAILTSAELFNPATDTSRSSRSGQSLTEARSARSRRRCPPGEVLIAGGYNPGDRSLSSAELFNPATDTFTKLTGSGQSLTEARDGAVAATLPSGEVLIAGGFNDSEPRLHERGTVQPGHGHVHEAHRHRPVAHRSTLTGVAATLPSGEVLIAGGYDGSSYLSSAELFNPATDTFTSSR